MRNHPLVHRTIKNLRDFGVRPGDQLAVALSGGADSVALWTILKQCQNLLGISLHVLHVHHGISKTHSQTEFRNQAQIFCENLAREHQSPFYANPPPPVDEAVHSESDLREYRWRWLRTWASEVCTKTQQRVFIALGHHREDLLETRLIHLIRGAGEKGLAGFSSHDTEKIRPLFNIAKSELLEMLRDGPIAWLEDPSNQQTDVLRNFIRHQWLPSLDETRPGSLASLSRSLEILSLQAPDTSCQLAIERPIAEGRLPRMELLHLSRNQQKAVVAQYFSQLAMRNYGHSHVEEFLKRLDTPQKIFKFKMLSKTWSVSEQWIEASRV